MKRIDTIMLENIEYSDYKKREDIHGTVLYPAVMIAPIQNEVLTELIQKNKIMVLELRYMKRWRLIQICIL